MLGQTWSYGTCSVLRNCATGSGGIRAGPSFKTGQWFTPPDTETGPSHMMREPCCFQEIASRPSCHPDVLAVPCVQAWTSPNFSLEPNG